MEVHLVKAITIMMDQTATSSREIVLLIHLDIEPGMGQPSRCRRPSHPSSDHYRLLPSFLTASHTLLCVGTMHKEEELRRPGTEMISSWTPLTLWKGCEQ
jgi:hypothetical protein